jgi:single-strand DNA-binding protein
MNRVNLIGRVSNELEVKYVRGKEGDFATLRFNLAVNKDKEKANFIPIRVLGKLAENLTNYQKKGSLIGVEGSIEIDQYEDKNGNKKSNMYVLANGIEYLEKRETSGEVSNFSNTNDKGYVGAQQMEFDDNDYPFVYD